MHEAPTAAIDENVVTQYVRAWLRKRINVDRRPSSRRQRKELYFKVSERARELRFPMGTGIAGHIARTGEVLSIPNAYDDSRFRSRPQDRLLPKSVLGVPLRSPDGKVLGVVQLINKLTGGVFDTDDVRVATAVADLTATALQNCRIHARAISQGSFFHGCAAEDGTAKTAEAIEARAVELLRCGGACVYLADTEADELCYRDQQQRLPASANSVLGYAYQNAELANLSITADQRQCAELSAVLGTEVTTALIVPLHRPDGKPCGVLLAANRSGGRRFTREDEATARNMGLQGGAVLYNVGCFEDARSARQRNDALLEVTRILNSQHQQRQLVEESLARARHLTDAERGALFLVDPKRRQLYSLLADGVTEIRFPMSTASRWAASRGTALNIKNAYEDDRFNPDVDRKTGYITRSILCMPILSRAGEVLGVTQMINKRNGPFGSDDEATLSALTQQLGVALDNARLFERASSIYNHLGALKAHEDFPATLRGLTAAAASVLACSHVVIYIHDRRTGQLVSRFTEGISDFSIHQDCGVPGHVFLSGAVFEVDDPARSSTWTPEMDLRTGFKTRNVLTVPQHAPGLPSHLGVVEALNKHVGKFQGEDGTTLQVFASLAGLVLQGWHEAEERRMMAARYDAQQALYAKLTTLTELPSIVRELHAMRAPTLLNCAAFSLILIDGDELVIKDDDFRTVRRLPRSHGISGAVAADGEPLCLDNALADSRYDPQVDCVPGMQTRTMAVVPVRASGKRDDRAPAGRQQARHPHRALLAAARATLQRPGSAPPGAHRDDHQRGARERAGGVAPAARARPREGAQRDGAGDCVASP